MSHVITSALLDQAAAAAQEAAHNMRGIAAATSTTIGSNPSEWEVQQLKKIQRLILTGKVRRCRHLKPSNGPRPLYAALWAPGQIVCGQCIKTLKPTYREEHTCDRCRTSVPELNACGLNFSILTITYGLCGNCAEENTKETR